jgi:dCMP deaminase
VNKRISWDELFMGAARLYARRCACLHYQVGVVFMRDSRILSAGYNGPPRHEPNCSDAGVGCAKEDTDGKRLPAGSGLCRGAHAEMNAVMNAAKEGVNLKGSSVYCTYSPCWDCAKHLSNLEIAEFVYEIEYKEEEGRRAIALLKRRGIKVRNFVPTNINTLSKEGN